ncbi:saccharopine dehydrogenase family protein [Paenibacillus sp. 1P07SE]|uniref:saccharopine dehydrogenase family protein n=1 Tax=Paenibacillus sp. 1P07SE TaxID=3132209 RepID=UPI0039A712D7
MNEKIVVIGGYGHVGGRIALELAKRYPGQVIAAGRNLVKAEAFCEPSEGRILPMAIDVSKETEAALLEDVRLVIMCMDQQHTTFVRACLDRGIHYIDVSADYRFLSQVEALHETAAGSGSTAVLSVGLAPGLTNLLAKHVHSLVDTTKRIEISVLLGMGDDHGEAALAWTLDNAATDFTARTHHSGEEMRRSSMGDGRRVDYGGSLGSRRAYRFNFADQHILSRTLHVPEVSTRLSLDPGWLTDTMAAAKQLGLLYLLRSPRLQALAIRAFSNIRIGQPIFAIKVEAHGSRNGQYAIAEAILTGRHESEVTALAAAAVATHLCSSETPGGVFHIEQLFDYNELAPAFDETASLTIR